MASAISNVLTAHSPDSAADTKPVLAPDVLLVLVEDGSSRLLDLDGQFFGLAAVSTLLLETALRQGTRQAARKVAEVYGVPLSRVEADLAGFLADLSKRGLLAPPGRRRGLRNLFRSFQAWSLLIALRLLLAAPLPFAWRVWLLLLFANFSLRVFGWARTVAAWRRHQRGAAIQSGNTAILEETSQVVRHIASGHLLLMECKERALCCWALLRDAGVEAELVVGVELFPFRGHCWCEYEGWVVGDDVERCTRFVPVLRST
jgi:hypothetical protein